MPGPGLATTPLGCKAMFTSRRTAQEPEPEFFVFPTLAYLTVGTITFWLLADGRANMCRILNPKQTCVEVFLHATGLLTRSHALASQWLKSLALLLNGWSLHKTLMVGFKLFVLLSSTGYYLHGPFELLQLRTSRAYRSADPNF